MSANACPTCPTRFDGVRSVITRPQDVSAHRVSAGATFHAFHAALQIFAVAAFKEAGRVDCLRGPLSDLHPC